MSKTPLMKIVQAAAERFDKRPEYRASVEARAELQHARTSSQSANPVQPQAAAQEQEKE